MNPRHILTRHVSGTKRGIERDMAMVDYRSYPGFAPSDLKRVDPYGGPDSGCLLHLIAELHRDQEIGAGNPDPWPRKGLDKRKSHFEFGSMYHHLVLEPDTFSDAYAVVDKPLLADLMQAARHRVANSDYNARFGEAQDWKRQHGRLPETDEEKRDVMLMRAAKVLQGAKPSEQPEFIGWKEDQEAAGKVVLWESDLDLAVAMRDAIWTFDATKQARKIVDAGTIEASLFDIEGAGDYDIQLKGRPDCFGRGVLLDLKHTGKPLSGPSFAQSVERFGYDFSAGAYVSLLDSLDSEVHTVGWLVQETIPPFRATTFAVGLNDPEQSERIRWGGWRFRELASLISEAYRTNSWDEWTEGGPKVLPPPSAYHQERRIAQTPPAFQFRVGLKAA